MQILFMMAALFLISLVTGQLQAAGGIKLVAGEEEGTAGEQVSVSIRAENAAGSDGGQFILNFDPALVRPVSVEPGPLVTEADSGLHMVNLEYEVGQLKFMWVTAAADTAEVGDICSIQFELLSEGETRLEFEGLIISPDSMEPATPVSGKITVRDTEVGQEEIEEDQLYVEEEAAVDEEKVAVDENEEVNDDEAAVSAVDQTNNIVLIAAIVGLAVIGAAVYLFLKQPKKGKH